MNRSDVILQVGAEGGDLTLYGVRTKQGWLFSRQVIDQTPDLIDEPTIQHQSETVTSWQEALELLSGYPWHRLYPLAVHKEFRELVWSAVVSRYELENDKNPRRLSNWKRLCKMSVDSLGISRMRLDPQLTGNVGLYYCCYRLSLLGWNVMPTARNARGVDIIAYSRDASRFVGVQVKALSKRDPVPLGTSLERVMGDFWIIVNKVATTPSAFILLPSEVTERAHRGEKEGRVSYWLEPTDYEQDLFREAWDRIGHG